MNVCFLIIRMTRRCAAIFACVVLCISVAVASPKGWDSKATPSERSASTAVGGFSDSQRALYHQGLEHLYHTHQRVGSYTIRQVVAQERTRQAQRAKARVAQPAGFSQSENSSGGSFTFVVFLVLTLIGIAVAAFRSRSSGSSALQAFDETPYRLNALVPISPQNIIAVSGETFYWEVTAEAIAPIKNRHYVSGSAGVSFRVARGIYVRSAGRRGHYVDDVRIGIVDRGRLLLSNVRLVFIGNSGETAYIGFTRILAIESLNDGLRVIVDKGHPQTYRTGSPREAIILRRLIAGDVSDHHVVIAPIAETATHASLPTAVDTTSSDKARATTERINRDRVLIAQQRANGTLSESEYAKSMHDLDALAAQASEWTT